MRKHLIEPGDVCLILAASIKPNAMADVSIVDPAAREKDYLDTLRYYLDHHPGFKRIVFIDNSGWPLDKFKAIADAATPDAQIELISLNLNDFPSHLGKSYGEMLLLERGIEQSKLAKESIYLAKLTGRTPLMNLTTMVQSIGRHFDLLCDIQDHPLYEWLRKPATGRKADTRFFLFRLRFWDKYIRGHLDEFDERRGEFVEGFFYRIARRQGTGETILNRFVREPDFAGRAGHGTKDYSSAGERKKRLIRDVLRRLTPWLKV
jgi:hypothetical protein